MTRARVVVVAAVLALLLPLLSGCGSSRIDAGRLQGSIAPTFGLLYAQQQVAMGNPRPVQRVIRPRAHCVKGSPADHQQGPGGDWVCYVVYTAAGPGTDVTATYNVDLQANGCYAADGDGPATLNGSRTITGAGYRQVLNPLWLINGCFDVG